MNTTFVNIWAFELDPVRDHLMDECGVAQIALADGLTYLVVIDPNDSQSACIFGEPVQGSYSGICGIPNLVKWAENVEKNGSEVMGPVLRHYYHVGLDMGRRYTTWQRHQFLGESLPEHWPPLPMPFDDLEALIRSFLVALDLDVIQHAFDREENSFDFYFQFDFLPDWADEKFKERFYQARSVLHRALKDDFALHGAEGDLLLMTEPNPRMQTLLLKIIYPFRGIEDLGISEFEVLEALATKLDAVPPFDTETLETALSELAASVNRSLVSIEPITIGETLTLFGQLSSWVDVEALYVDPLFQRALSVTDEAVRVVLAEAGITEYEITLGFDEEGTFLVMQIDYETNRGFDLPDDLFSDVKPDDRFSLN